jgi:hypothetical protein
MLWLPSMTPFLKAFRPRGLRAAFLCHAPCPPHFADSGLVSHIPPVPQRQVRCGRRHRGRPVEASLARRVSVRQVLMYACHRLLCRGRFVILALIDGFCRSFHELRAVLQGLRRGSLQIRPISRRLRAIVLLRLEPLSPHSVRVSRRACVCLGAI